MKETKRLAGPEREQFMHRLEAFSDIVIAFSLAEVGVNLGLPHQATDLLKTPVWLLAFLWSFAIICSMWYAHHRLFAAYFVPGRLTMFLNFAVLASIVLMVYAINVFEHFSQNESMVQPLFAYRFFFVMQCINSALLAALFALGVRDRYAVLTAQQRYAGVRSAIRYAVVAVLVAITVGIMPLFEPAIAFWLPPVGLMLGHTFCRYLYAAIRGAFGEPQAASG